jgi:restriction endonuclease Mrr
MALPGDELIQAELMRLLMKQPGQKLDSAAAYTKLAESFPQLTHDETHIPYQNSVSHWANRVQFAVLHLRKQGWLRSPDVGERGVWEVTPEGRDTWKKQDELGNKLLDELNGL